MTMSSPLSRGQDSLFETALGGRKSVALLIAVGSGLLDELLDGAAPIEALADRVGLHRDAARITLGLLNRLGFVHATSGQVALHPEVRAALTGPWGQMLRLEARLFQIGPEGRAWMDAAYGRAFAETVGWMADSRALALYPGAMRTAGGEIALRTLRLLRPLTERSLVLDVGGGTGTFGVPLLRHFAGARWVVVDMPPLEAVAADLAAQEDASDRMQFIPFDVRNGLPADTRSFDAIILSQILHLLDMEARDRLLAQAVARLAPGGRIAVLDFFLDPGDDASLVPWLMAMDWMRYGTMFFESSDQVAARLVSGGTDPPMIRPMGSTGTKLVLATRSLAARDDRP